jgi:lysophospholipase L1-like esterase
MSSDPDRRAPAPLSVPAPPTGRHLTARDALIAIGLCTLLLLAFEGRSIRRSGEEMKSGWERSLVLAVGRPAGAISDALGLASVKDTLVGWVHPDDGLSGPGGFDEATVGTAARGVPPVTPDAFDPRALGARQPAPRPLRTVLVTGDSLSQPLDAKVARAFSRSSAGVDVVRDARIGTGISQSDLLDWGQLSVAQVRKRHPDAIVVFLGANEGFPLRSGTRKVDCCGADWAAAYASRVRRVMNTFRQGGAARVYWLNLPAPRDPARQRISRAVNAAIAVAAEPYRAQVRVLDLSSLFTPGGRYRDAMDVGGRRRIVRESDGIHLNDEGAAVALGPVLAALRADYGAKVPSG